MSGQKGKERKYHKYIRRYMKNGKWRYVYKEIGDAAKTVSDFIEASWVMNTEYVVIDPIPKKSRKEPKDHKYIAKIPLGNGKVRYFYSKKELEAFYKKHPAMKLDFPLKSNNYDGDMDESFVNPNYDNAIFDNVDKNFHWDYGYHNNCYDCTLTYDARRKGYDVTAISDKDGQYGSMIASFYIGGVKRLKRTRNDGAKTSAEEASVIEKELKKNPDNSHGDLHVSWMLGGAHSVTWEKVDGEIIIRDNQTNRKVPFKKYFDDSFYHSIKPGKSAYLRTDDLQLAPKAAKYLQPSDHSRSRSDAYERYNNGDITRILTKKEVSKSKEQKKRYADSDLNDIADGVIILHKMSYDAIDQGSKEVKKYLNSHFGE